MLLLLAQRDQLLLRGLTKRFSIDQRGLKTLPDVRENTIMITRLVLAAAFAVVATAASAQTAPAPANPLQQRRAPAPAPATTPAAPEAAPAAKTAAKGSGAARRTQCSQEYQAAKKANTLNGQKWSKFYSACNTRLKAAGQ